MTTPNVSPNDFSEAEMRELMQEPAYNEALALCGNDIVLGGQVKGARAQIAELRVFAPISPTFAKAFGNFGRKKGELFVPVRRGWPQPNVVSNPNPHASSVIQMTRVVIDGREVSFGSVLKERFPDEDFDGYDLLGAQEGAKMRLAPTMVIPRLIVAKDTRDKVARAVIQVSRTR